MPISGDVIFKCPLGEKCKEIKDNKEYRCRAFVRITGEDPQDPSIKYDEVRCSIFEWLPILLMNIDKGIRGTTESVVSMRDESVQRQDFFNSLMVSMVRKAAAIKNGKQASAISEQG